MGGVRGRGNRRLASVRAALAVAGLVAIGGPAAAQTAACELDVWPAAFAHTTFQGWIRAGEVDGARRGVKGYPDYHAGVLDAAEQARLMATIDWRGAFNDPSLAVVIHTAPTGSADDRTRASRLAGASSSPCYRELIITSSIVESGVFAGLSVRILALRKRFDGAAAAPANFSSMSQAPILFSDDDKAAKDASARMDTAVRAAFVQAVSKFAVMQSFH